MPEYAIRVATTADHHAVSNVLTQSYSRLMQPAYDASMLSRVLPLITQANPKLLASGLYYVAQDAEDALVGCGGWSPEQPGEDGSQQGVGHIRHFATHPDFLGVGIGRAIYQQCETQAIVAGIVRFVCYSSLNAEPFYTALGFNTVGPTTVRMSSGCVFPIMQMQRTIKSTWRFSGG